jgi:hypothetical protein
MEDKWSLARFFLSSYIEECYILLMTTSKQKYFAYAEQNTLELYIFSSNSKVLWNTSQVKKLQE